LPPETTFPDFMMLNFRGADESAHAPPVSAMADEEGHYPAGRAKDTIDARQLVRELKAFAEPRPARSMGELAVTISPFMALCALMFVAIKAGFLPALVLTVPAGLLLLRLFLIQHDCGHGAFFRTRSRNDWLGRVIGVLTFTPYDCWRHLHALHHAGTGNLDARGHGDIDTLTVREFDARSRGGQLLYSTYRHPIVLLGLGPAYQFLFRQRLPIGLMKSGWIYWVSAIGTNAATALLFVLLIHLFGISVVALVSLPVLLIAASVGVWLFYIQHQFEDAHWEKRANWAFHEAALHGSTHLQLPPVLRWFTANIGVHHVHHLASRVPFYRLPEVLRAHPQLTDKNRVTLLQSFAALRLALWDEDQRRLVPFP
jgi:omega-6 fatty acid desaturase (delta-12 desaturase)